MPKQVPDQYGQILLLRDIRDASSAKALTRIHFDAGLGGSSYDEAWLQNLIMVHPGLLPVAQIEAAFAEMVPICTEMPMRAGFVDNVFVTPSGDIALIECKLWRNPEARRKVVAQIIDYASEMRSWNYETLENAIKRARLFARPDGKSSLSLYDLISAGREIDESAFHDAVSRNLQRGRFLLLIVGDGIREGVETLTEYLQHSAGLHFTLSIVELALFELEDVGLIAQPRLLARTKNIERGVVTLNDSRMNVEIPSDISSLSESPRTTTITEERFFEELELNSPGASQRVTLFLAELLAQNVQADYGSKTLTLRWLTPDSKNWNLGTIVTSGEVWFEYHAGQARNLNRVEASKEYLTSIAAFVPGATLKETRSKTTWNLADRHGHTLRIDALLSDESRANAWLRAIAEFQHKIVDFEE